MRTPSTWAWWGRIATALLLLGALIDPQIRGASGPVHLVLVLDDSASLPRAAVDAAWRRLTPALAELPVGSLLSLVRFGAGAVTELAAADLGTPPTRTLLAAPAPPRRLALATGGTDLAQGLQAGLRLALATGPEATSGVTARLLLVSDGHETQGNPETTIGTALDLAQDLGVQIQWLAPDPGPPGPDAWVRAIEGPRRLALGQAAALRVHLGARGWAGPVTGTLDLEADGRPLAHQSITLDPDVPSGMSQTLALPLHLDSAGVRHLRIRLRVPGDRVPDNDTRDTLVQVRGPAPVLVLGGPHPSPVAESLRQGGWPVRVLDRDQAAGGALDRALGEAAVLILDGVAAADLGAADWQAIRHAVTGTGLGLVALGGPRTYASGGYRHSPLEDLLPVLAEAPRPLPPAAVLFLVDASGSMDQPSGVGPSRLALARRAVITAAGALAPQDSAGLIGFDAAPVSLLPLARRDDQATALAAAWDLIPGGGTRLAPALGLALAQLQAADPGQRLLVLVSDGRFADAARPEERQALAGATAAAGVELVAMAVGEDAQTETLGALVGDGPGRVLRVAEVSELPQLMQAEVAARRVPVEVGPIQPKALAPLPFAPGIAPPWPELTAYQVTRPRPETQVYLAAANGDPLLAAWSAGNGRALALPGGLGPWAPAWQQWPDWGPFLGGLVQWAAGGPGAGPERTRVAIRETGDALDLTIEAGDDSGDWAGIGGLPVRVQDPSGDRLDLDAEAQAPGLLSLRVPAPHRGRYDLSLGKGAEAEHLAFWHAPLDEFIPRAGTDLDAPLANRQIATFTPGGQSLAAPAGHSGARGPLAALALLIFVTTLISEAWSRASPARIAP